MPSLTSATGLGGRNLRSIMRTGFLSAKPSALGVAVAYISIAGFYRLKKLGQDYSLKYIRIVTDLNDGVTHPTALTEALNQGWFVRGVNRGATFHPKLYVGGTSFDTSGAIVDPSLLIVGSANLSENAFEKNAECSYIHVGQTAGGNISGAFAWRDCWNAGVDLDATAVSTYADYFAERNKDRSAADMISLGVADDPPKFENQPINAIKSPNQTSKAMPNVAATAAWAGLASFTGDYNLQLEFSSDAASVLRRLLGSVSTDESPVFYCDDGEERRFIYRFYEHNGMFRLNIHNDTPNAQWARDNKAGIGLVQIEDGKPSFRIVKPSDRMTKIIDRSMALGTFGKTPTRLYGWY